MQSFSALERTETDMNLRAANHYPEFLEARDDWNGPLHANDCHGPAMPATNYLGLPIPNLPSSDDHFPYGTATIDEPTVRLPCDEGIHEPSFAFRSPFTDRMPSSSDARSQRSIHTHAHFCQQPSFTSFNAQAGVSGCACTVEPSDTGLKASYPPSLVPSHSVSTDSGIHSATPPLATSPESVFGNDSSSRKHRSESIRSYSEGRSQSPPTRRRRTENVQPGSARAIYLEKNRQAASKCRNKQKRQQEELVVSARDAERKNKQLKVEVEYLKSDMRDLMDVVGRHSNCPDRRLSAYLQREADRLVAGLSESPGSGRNSPKRSSSTPGYT